MSGFQRTEVLAICRGNTVTSSGMEELWPRIPDIRPQYFAQGYKEEKQNNVSDFIFRMQNIK